jgi:hypothetical protein
MAKLPEPKEGGADEAPDVPATRNIPRPSVARFVYKRPLTEFVSLTKTLTDEDYSRSFAELSPEKQALVKSRFPLPWDDLTVEERQEQAASWDFQHDPANQDLLEKLENLQEATTEAIDYVKGDLSLAASGRLPDWAKQHGPVRLEDIHAFLARKLEVFEAQGKSLEAATNANLSSALEDQIVPNAPLPIFLSSGFEEWLSTKCSSDDKPEPHPAPPPPAFPRRATPLQRLVTALEGMSANGVNIASDHRDGLCKQALDEAKIKLGSYGSSMRTLSALLKRRARRTNNSSALATRPPSSVNGNLSLCNNAASAQLPPYSREYGVEKMSEPLAHTIDAAVKISGIGRTSLYLLIGTGKIAARKCGNRTLIMADSLRDYVASFDHVRAA